MQQIEVIRFGEAKRDAPTADDVIEQINCMIDAHVIKHAAELPDIIAAEAGYEPRTTSAVLHYFRNIDIPMLAPSRR